MNYNYAGNAKIVSGYVSTRLADAIVPDGRHQKSRATGKATPKRKHYQKPDDKHHVRLLPWKLWPDPKRSKT